MLEADGLLVVHPSVPAGSVPELIALARAKPNGLTFASAGMGTASHLAGELFKTMAKVEIVHVPYKGNVPAITDLLAGQTSMLFATMPTVLPHAKAGKLRAPRHDRPVACGRDAGAADGRGARSPASTSATGSRSSRPPGRRRRSCSGGTPR